MRILPAFALQQEMKLYSMDIKDALFVTDPSTEKIGVLILQEYLSVMAGEDMEFNKTSRERAIILLRVLLGQRGAAVLWSDFLK